MRIPRTPIRTTWKADWLIEFSIALAALGILTREAIFAAVGIGVSLTLAWLGFVFHQKLAVMRKSLQVLQRLSRTRIFLGNSVDGNLRIRNQSQLAAQVVAVQPTVEETLRFEFSSSFDRLLLPGTEASSEFTVTPSARGHFKISSYQLTARDARDLFAAELSLDSVGAGWIEVYPGAGIAEPLTPLALYGGGLERLRKGPSGTDYAGIRQYTPGDDYHRIEWKATARLRTLMVKEFHPEGEATLQILIDAGKTMHQQSYVGTRLDEALAVAELLTESVVTSKTPVGIWVYDETELLKAIKPTMATEQVPRLRELSLALQTGSGSKEPPAALSPPRTLPSIRSPIAKGERMAMFIRLLRLRLGLIHRRTGVYKALTEARATVGGRGVTVVVLTDLSTNVEALWEAVLSHQERGAKIIIVQVGAAWRLSDDLELAYAEYQRNSRTLRRLERFGLTVFDLRPEALVEAIGQQIGKSVPVAPVHR